MESEEARFMASENEPTDLPEAVNYVYSMMIDTPLTVKEIREVIEFQLQTAKECLQNPGFLTPKEIEQSIAELMQSLDRLESIVDYLLARDLIKKYEIYFSFITVKKMNVVPITIAAKEPKSNPMPYALSVCRFS